MVKYIFLFLVFIFSVQLWSQSSIDSLKKEIKIALDNRKSKDVAFLYRDLSQHYFSAGQSEEGLKTAIKSAEHFEAIGDNYNYHISQQGLARYFERIEKFQSSIRIHKAANVVYKQKHDLIRYKKTLIELTRLYNFTNKPDVALEQVKEFENIEGFELGGILFYRLEIEKIKALVALDYFDKAANVADSLHVNCAEKKLIDVCFQLQILTAEILIGQKKLSSTESMLDSLISQSQGRPEYKKKLFFLKSEFHKAKDDFASAFEDYETYAILNDSLLKAKRIEALDEISLKYESQQKEVELRALRNEMQLEVMESKRKSLIINAFIVGLFLVLIGLYFLIRYYRKQMEYNDIISVQREALQKQEILELQKNIEIKSMQSMLKGEEAERERIAKDLHDSMGGLLSTIKLQFGDFQSKVSTPKLEKSFLDTHELIDYACQEVRNISQNLQPISLRSLGLTSAVQDMIDRLNIEGNPELNFQSHGTVKPIGNTASLMIYRIIQELVHNAIKHANCKEIFIQINQQDDKLSISVEDDGIGFDVNEIKRGMGLNNIETRVDFLKGEIEIDSKKGDGTMIMVNLENNYLVIIG